MNGRGGSVLKSRNMSLIGFGIVEGGDETLRAVLLAYTSRALESLVLLTKRSFPSGRAASLQRVPWP